MFEQGIKYEIGDFNVKVGSILLGNASKGVIVEVREREAPPFLLSVLFLVLFSLFFKPNNIIVLFFIKGGILPVRYSQRLHSNPEPIY